MMYMYNMMYIKLHFLLLQPLPLPDTTYLLPFVCFSTVEATHHDNEMVMVNCSLDTCSVYYTLQVSLTVLGD